ncbi:large ribosomal subunit protein uL29m-like [Glandiceps talaboti]
MATSIAVGIARTHRIQLGGIYRAISSFLCSHNCAQKENITSFSRSYRNSFHNPSVNITQVQSQSLCHRSIHTSTQCRGLEEFFEDPKNVGEMEVKSGRPWELDELRTKDSVTLHKLWYVLLKERNMLLTMKEEAKTKKVFMPSPERLDKVKTSMDNLMQVVKERNDAVRELRTGEKEEIPTRMSYNMFGEKVRRKLREWPLPYFMNPKVQQEKHFYYPFVRKFIRMRIELEMKKEKRKEWRMKRAKEALRRKFPDAEID